MTAKAPIMLPQAKSLRRIRFIHNYDNAKGETASDAEHGLTRSEYGVMQITVIWAGFVSGWLGCGS